MGVAQRVDIGVYSGLNSLGKREYNGSRNEPLFSHGNRKFAKTLTRLPAERGGFLMTEYPRIEIEEYFTKIGGDVFRYWRVKGNISHKWIEELTSYTDLPYAEIKDQKQADK